MKFLLDTDHISILQQQSGPEFANLSGRIAQHRLVDFTMCMVSFHEQVLGCQSYLGKARTNAEVIRGYRMLDRVLDAFAAGQVLSFDNAAATIVDGLKAQRVRIATMDLRIAAITLDHRLILLTRNRADFSKVPGLAFEDWTV